MSDTDTGTSPRKENLVQRVERLAALAERRWELSVEADRSAGLDPDEAISPVAAPGPRARARELRDHSRTFLLPRARDLDAPLLIAILGPTGSGKSSLINALAGSVVSRTGVLRPTTRDAIAVGSVVDLDRLLQTGVLSAIPPDRLERRAADGLPGIVIVDAPDVDSVEHENRAIADHLLEAADLCLFVTTPTRYADRVAWDVLRRAEMRRLPLVVVLNRMPAGDDWGPVLDDVRRLLGETELGVRDIQVVPEGALAAGGASLDPAELGRVPALLTELSEDHRARRALAEQALGGALLGVGSLARAVASDLEHEARQGEVLVEHARRAFAEQADLMFERLFSGSVLREEVIRHWHSFVGADQVTRLFASGIGRVRGTFAAILRGTPRAPVAAVQEGATDDISALVEGHAADAARHTSERWAADPRGALLLAGRPELWSSSEDIAAAARGAVETWVATIATDVAERGASRRGAARVAAVGVNALAVMLMLVTFTHTGGLTGAEAGIAAATAFLNQKLLNALFGEAAVQEMLLRARQRLRDALTRVLEEERRRFDGLVADRQRLEELAAELRATVA